ncbi:MAG: PSD1 and planctomycete cytochrome C domain-containing protein [Verrucomicrobiota bacterium]
MSPLKGALTSPRVLVYASLTALSSTIWTFVGAAADPEKIDFNRDVRPILSNHCYFCHGPDVENNKADLRLDIRELAIESGAIVPGNAGASLAIERVSTDDEFDIMPPPEVHKPLSEEQIRTLAAWIDQGAEYEIHWSYKRVERPELDSIDAILKSGLKRRGLGFSKEAPAETLVRRVYLDTIGLPPTPEEANKFLGNQSPNAYEALVDELLASPHFGENMAIDWLDAVRFADTVGYHGDQSRDASPFRDYVINAFNTNKPYDEFVTEQLAGDLLPNATIQQRVAASFNRLNQISSEGGIQDKEYIKKYQAERIRTTSTALLGSTLACAECHDHKYDPFTAKDFYSFGAFFADILEKGANTGDGSYQEKDVSEYLAPPEIFEQRRFGPTMRVPNRTFLQNPEHYEAENQRRLNSLRSGTDTAAREFENWLTEKRKAAAAGIPADYYLTDLTNDSAVSFIGAPLKVENGYRYQFEVRLNEIAEGEKHGFGILYSFEDTEYLVYWGNGVNEKKPHRKLINRSDLPKADTWTELYIYPDSLKTHRGKSPKSISFVSSETTIDGNAVDVRNFRLKTKRQKVPIGDLKKEGVTLLEKYLTNEAIDADLERLRVIYYEAHAASPDQIELRNSYRAMNDYLNGTRNTPATISAKPREVRVLPRGDWTDESGAVVLPATPEFLDFAIASDPGERLSRLDLAEWIVHRDNPLTARTYVNRVWGHFFGTPISSAPEDLGLQGEYPVYPELLELLASDFMESGWDVKQLVKSILMSEAYRQSSRSTPELDELDPYNRLIARQSPRRLRAENIRDNALAISDLLVRRIGGSSAKPYQPDGYYQHLNFPKRTYETSTGEDQYRRGLYMHWQRTFLHPMLIAFDAPSRDECAVARPISNTPLQALNKLNDPSFVEAAIALSHAILLDHPGDDLSRLEYAYRRVLTRDPKTREQDILMEFLDRERSRFSESPEEASALVASANFTSSNQVETTELAAWTGLTRALLNLHETITRY